MRTPSCRCLPSLAAALLCATGCAGSKPVPATDDVESAGPETSPDFTAAEAEPASGDETTGEDEELALLDRTRQTVYGITIATVRGIDNFFGSTDVEEEATITRGRLSVGGQYDDRNELKQRVRLKARIALPALSERTSLIFGRGDTNELVDGSGDDNVDTLPARFNDFEDEDWLLGIGYSRDAKLRRGWSFGAGVKVASPLEPFVRATYRWNRVFHDDWLWRVEPRIFLQNQRGAGISLQNTLDYVVNENWLLRSWSVMVAEEEVEGISWTSKLIAYQNLNRKSALSYAVYGVGETEYEVPVRDYGIELRYRRQVLREWFFVEFLTFLSWPRDFLIEEREANPGVGIEFEMQFGDWPGRQQTLPERPGE